MDDFIMNYLSGLRFGERQVFKNMTAFPLAADMDGIAVYRLLE